MKSNSKTPKITKRVEDTWRNPWHNLARVGVAVFLIWLIFIPKQSTDNTNTQQSDSPTPSEKVDSPTPSDTSCYGSNCQMQALFDKMKEPRLQATVSFAPTGMTITNPTGDTMGGCEIALIPSDPNNPISSESEFDIAPHQSDWEGWGTLADGYNKRFDWQTTVPTEVNITCMVNNTEENQNFTVH